MTNDQILFKMELAVIAWGDELTRIRKIEEQNFCNAKGWSGALTASQYASMNAIIDPMMLKTDASKNLERASKVLREFKRYHAFCNA